jgi:hypothetical protein
LRSQGALLGLSEKLVSIKILIGFLEKIGVGIVIVGYGRVEGNEP